MTLLLNSKDVHVEFPTRLVLNQVTLGINSGDRIGIVGKNGDGKSTLLSVLAGNLTPTQGEVARQSKVTVGVLGQSDELDESATVAYALVGDAPEYTWASNRTTREIVEALIGDIDMSTRIAELSGGQRRRLGLAQLLIGYWDVLMLDEPTNHLDVHTIAWLAKHLRERWSKNTGALLVISHDRWFLDEVCDSMWEVHDGQVDAFEGGYSAYILQRVERDRVAVVTEQRRRNLARKELAWLSRGPQARSTKPKFRVASAWELIENEPLARNKLVLKRMAMKRLGKKIIDITDVSAGYGNEALIEDLTWLIGPGDRFGILGVNGSGKTSLLKLLEGTLAPLSGEIKIGKTAKMATLSQQLDELVEFEDMRIHEILATFKSSYMVEGKSLSPAQLLERLGFESTHLNARASDLSGGQKRQLSLLMALMKEPNVLILDEPGNDLDTDTLAALEDLLDSWPGTLIIVSHDRYLMERVTDQQFALIGGQLRHVPGGVDEYLKLIAKSEATSEGESIERKRNTSSDVVAKEAAKSSGSPKHLSGGQFYEMRKQLASVERKLETLNRQLEEHKAKASEVNSTDYQALIDHQDAQTELESQISELEIQWIELSEALG
ncbi:MAG: ABC-F family ATP-binding cassette domain-containing protein [Coriobacteriia bacterium]|nr:ABC-F family ATP-binding cassette domain-containing protein [Coriobacteriia bacterium]